jgi:hypothetical protein
MKGLKIIEWEWASKAVAVALKSVQTKYSVKKIHIGIYITNI